MKINLRPLFLALSGFEKEHWEMAIREEAEMLERIR
jgi:hypothetical protein